MESRLKRRTIKQSKKQLYVYVASIVALIFITLNFGPALITVAGDTIDKITGKPSQTQNITEDTDLKAPRIDALPSATPSAFITITGSVDYPDAEIELFVNDTKEDTEAVDENQTYEFSDIKLNDGNNFIKVRAIVNNKRSDFTEISISKVSDAPDLEISTPASGTEIRGNDRMIRISGKTAPENRVTVGGSIAIVDGSGNFSHTLNLNDGENKINVTATDPAGQATTKEITVSYSP